MGTVSGPSMPPLGGLPPPPPSASQARSGPRPGTIVVGLSVAIVVVVVGVIAAIVVVRSNSDRSSSPAASVGVLTPPDGSFTITFPAIANPVQQERGTQWIALHGDDVYTIYPSLQKEPPFDPLGLMEAMAHGIADGGTMRHLVRTDFRGNPAVRCDYVDDDNDSVYALLTSIGDRVFIILVSSDVDSGPAKLETVLATFQPA